MGQRLAVGFRTPELNQEAQQVVSVLAGDIESNEEVHVRMLQGHFFHALAQEDVAVGRLGELEFGSSRLEIVAEKDGVVAVA